MSALVAEEEEVVREMIPLARFSCLETLQCWIFSIGDVNPRRKYREVGFYNINWQVRRPMRKTSASYRRIPHMANACTRAS